MTKQFYYKVTYVDGSGTIYGTDRFGFRLFIENFFKYICPLESEIKAFEDMQEPLSTGTLSPSMTVDFDEDLELYMSFRR